MGFIGVYRASQQQMLRDVLVHLLRQKSHKKVLAISSSFKSLSRLYSRTKLIISCHLQTIVFLFVIVNHKGIRVYHYDSCDTITSTKIWM